MSKFNQILWLIILLMFISACQPSTEALPTLRTFPTATASDTATATASLTSTATQTNTPSPTASNTATHTPTNTATRTRIPTQTATNTLTPTATHTPFPTATFTALPTRTPDTPVIENFQANKTTADNGEPIILRWAVQADSARLEVIDSNGIILQTLDVTLVGTFTTNTPSTGAFVTYRLTAVRGTEELLRSITVPLQVTCTPSWFFSNPPSSIGCPTTSANFVPLTFQQFVNGFMFQATVNGTTKICAVQLDRDLYSCYVPSTFTGTPPVTPPAGQQAPDAIFESVFYTQLATGGLWYDIIGFATGTALSTNVQTQTSDTGTIFYSFPIGVYGFDSNLNGNGVAVVEVTQ
ncbi:MAG: hypothetical protein AAFV93_03480 [Chloroflexota bacterium]